MFNVWSMCWQVLYRSDKKIRQKKDLCSHWVISNALCWKRISAHVDHITALYQLKSLLTQPRTVFQNLYREDFVGVRLAWPALRKEGPHVPAHSELYLPRQRIQFYGYQIVVVLMDKAGKFLSLEFMVSWRVPKRLKVETNACLLKHFSLR